MSLNLREQVVQFLSAHEGERFKARDIAEWLVQTAPEAAARKLQNSAALQSQAQLLNQIVAEIGANRPQWEKRHPQLRTTDGQRPRLYSWSTQTQETEVKTSENPLDATHAQSLSEHDLYPLLITYLRNEFQVHAQRIDEKRSSNQRGAGGNKWLFPDIVGMEDLKSGLHSEVVQAIRASKARSLRLWSFELKVLINVSNVREAYYQAVSNSSWAHQGYLVASAIEGSQTMKELRLLFAMHGIGLIRLNSEDPSESEILIPARERPDIEWAMASRLADENKDFAQFMKHVRQFHQTGDM